MPCFQSYLSTICALVIYCCLHCHPLPVWTISSSRMFPTPSCPCKASTVHLAFPFLGKVNLLLTLHGFQFSSVAQSCLTLCDPMDCSKQGLPDHRHLPEFTQAHVHWVSDAIQPSHLLLSPSPPAFNFSQLHSFTFIENHLSPRNSISAKFFSKGRPFISFSRPVLQGSEAVCFSFSLLLPHLSLIFSYYPSPSDTRTINRLEGPPLQPPSPADILLFLIPSPKTCFLWPLLRLPSS